MRQEALQQMEMPTDLESAQSLISTLLASQRTADQQLQTKHAELHAKDRQLQTKDRQLRSQDMALQQQAAKLEKLQRQKDELERLYNELLQRAFRRRSERYIQDPEQLRLDFGDTPEAADAAAGLAEAVEEAGVVIRQHVRRPRKKRDERLPEHLPRQETIAEPTDQQKTCPEHGQRMLLPESMWDRTEKLVYKPAELLVVVTKYPKYACQDQPQCGVTSAERPTGLVEGDKYDTSVAAQVITAKYGYHLPIYRQQDYFASSGWTPCRSTLLNLLSAAHFVIEPLVEYFKHSVQQDEIIGCDETSVTLLYPKTIPKFDLDDPKQRRAEEVFRQTAAEKKPSITARMWAYRGVTVPLNVFDFTVSRHRDGPQLFFADYRGKLIADCWSGFEAITAGSGGAIQRGACTAHARRKVFDARETYRQDAHQLLSWFGELYDIEDRAKQMSAEERLALRQSESLPIWNQMGPWLEAVMQRTTNMITHKSNFRAALQYIRNHWQPLQLYLTDGRMPIDNNLTEQLMKQVAIGRKNWLFVGSLAAGNRAAAFLTLVSSALRSDLDVWLYIKDILNRLLAGSTDYHALLPWHWAAAHPEAIRHYRITERQDRTTRQKTHRTHRRQPPR